eukprot:9672686-Karenia_brevis.AAC.1
MQMYWLHPKVDVHHNPSRSSLRRRTPNNYQTLPWDANHPFLRQRWMRRHWTRSMGLVKYWTGMIIKWYSQ